MKRGKRRLLAAAVLLALLLAALALRFWPRIIAAVNADGPAAVMVESVPDSEKSSVQGFEGVTYLKQTNSYIAIEGFPFLKENGEQLCRLRISESERYNAAVQAKNEQTSGGQLRFRTNSQQISLRVRYAEFEQDSNNSLVATAGLEIWVETGDQNSCVAVVCPSYGQRDYRYDFKFSNADGSMFGVTVKLPSFCGVEGIEIGLQSGALLSKPKPHALAPIVFYGSSITQGAGASRPGNTYVQLVAEELDAELINFGFSSGALGENVMAETIATLPELAAVIIDYDYNAVAPEYLERTHYNFYAAIRAVHPDVPIVVLSRVNDRTWEGDPIETRRHVIKQTYERARAAGDRNIYFVDGRTVMGDSRRDRYFVDGIHPNDLGHIKIAEALLPVLQKAFRGQRAA